MEEKKILYKVIEIMPVESGTSQTTGREWKSREFVAEEIMNARYPNQLLMRLSGDDVQPDQLLIQILPIPQQAPGPDRYRQQQANGEARSFLSHKKHRPY